MADIVNLLILESLTKDPFNIADLAEAIESKIPHPEIKKSVQTGLELQITYWKLESEKVKDRKISYQGINEHLERLHAYACIIENCGLYTYMEFL
ncbi:MAG: hypothetical protein PHF86_05585 [Candidatus Nanoarchaeia archaeon]|nr:hypothetical protein [Candidatus Nanoarchaeia archaeon]